MTHPAAERSFPGSCYRSKAKAKLIGTPEVKGAATENGANPRYF